MSWITIRDGIDTTLTNAITGLTVRDTVPDTIADKDFAVVLYGDTVLEPAGHGTKTMVNFRVAVRCARATLEDAQEALDAYIWPTGSGSIIAAIKAAGTLQGTVDATRWVSVDRVGPIEATKGWAMQADINFVSTVTA